MSFHILRTFDIILSKVSRHIAPLLEIRAAIFSPEKLVVVHNGRSWPIVGDHCCTATIRAPGRRSVNVLNKLSDTSEGPSRRRLGQLWRRQCIDTVWSEVRGTSIQSTAASSSLFQQNPPVFTEVRNAADKNPGDDWHGVTNDTEIDLEKTT